MKSRDERLKAVARTISSHAVSSQDELLVLMGAQGHDITQATLSRDLRVLRVGKVSAQTGGYVYALPEESNRNRDELVRDFQRGYLSMESSGNLVVLKTLPGHAQATAWALDNLEVPAILGTVAGDDTILIILRQDFTFETLQVHLVKLMPDWEA
ncbi:MAG: arginine repressor [Spirochaetales bacterium]